MIMFNRCPRFKVLSHICVGCVHSNQNDRKDQNTGTTVTHACVEKLAFTSLATLCTVNTCPGDFVVAVVSVAANATKGSV